MNNNVTFKKDINNSIIVVINGIRLLPGWILHRIRSYRKDLLLIVPDLLWISLLICLSSTYLYLVFILAYFGTETKVFSNTIILIAANWLDKNIAPLTVSIFSILVIVLLFWRAMHKLQSFLKGFFIASLLLTLALINSLFFSPFIKNELIRINYEIAVHRAEEFSHSEQYDQVGYILNHLPNNEPPPNLDDASIKEMDSVFTYSPELHFEDEIDPFTKSLILKNFQDVAAKYYDDGRYTDVLELACNISSEENRLPLLIYWRSATYRLAHNPDWGPDVTIAWIDELVQRNPKCANLISPFWTAIPSGIAWLVDDKRTINFNELGNLYSGNIGSPEELSIEEVYPPTTIRPECVDRYGNKYVDMRCEYDSQLLDSLLEKFPDAPYADYVKLMRGQYDLILMEGYDKNPYVTDQAYYRKGLAQFKQKDYEGALQTFQSFLFNDAFQNHIWRDDARYQVAECYLKLGKYIDALENYVEAENESDGELPYYAKTETNLLYTADVLMPISDLETVVTMEMFPKYQSVLLYTLAERYLADNKNENARITFQQVIDTFGTKTVIPEKDYTYGQLAQKKLKVIQVLSYYEKKPNPNSPLLLADYLNSFDTFSPFENDLRYLIPMFHSGAISADYLNTRSRTVISNRLREKFIEDHPDDPKVPELIIIIAKGYEEVASWADLPPSGAFFFNARDQAAARFLEYIQKYPNYNTEYLDYALEHAGSIYMVDCMKSWGCKQESIIKMREVYQDLVSKYPRHHLANNMLNWIAWSYCNEANTYPFNKEKYITGYKNALNTYQQIINNHPDGLTGQNARDNIVIIKDKISDPENKNNHPQPNWGWYTK